MPRDTWFPLVEVGYHKQSTTKNFPLKMALPSKAALVDGITSKNYRKFVVKKGHFELLYLNNQNCYLF